MSKDNFHDKTNSPKPLTESDLDHTAYLPTWEDSGKRKWIYPKRLKGHEASKRFKLSLLLMAFYVIAPWVEVNGIPALRFDVVHNQISIAFNVFRFTDIKYLVFVFAILGIGLFYITSLRGRIWCGDFCPQTVFLEWLIRPIEELIEGPAERRRVNDSKSLSGSLLLKKSLKHLIYLAIAALIAHAFLGFFISPYELIRMVQHSPAEHMTAFIITWGITGAIYLDFAYLREQFCSFLCPYARFQAIMIDGNTPSIAYDYNRGEPRSRKKKKDPADPKGDCIDCGLCVRVCPTGIDIRNGNQLECIQCRRCEDACNSVMTSLKRDNGLIRMETENNLTMHKEKKFRARPWIYGSILITLMIGLVSALAFRSEIHLHVTRQEGPPFAQLPTGEYSNAYRFTFENNTSEMVPLHIELKEPAVGKIICGGCSAGVASYKSMRVPVIVILPEHAPNKRVVIEHVDSGKRVILPFLKPYNF